MNEIAKRIEDTIHDGNKTVIEAAEYIGVNRKQLSRWASQNGAEMGIYKLKAFCTFYGVSADYILGLPKGLDWPR